MHLLGGRAGHPGEEESKTGGEGQDRARGDLPLGSPLAQGSDDQRPTQGEQAHAGRDRQPQQNGPRGARQTDVGQGMGGEGGVPGDGEVAHGSGGHGDAQSSNHGVAHEGGGEDLHPMGVEDWCGHEVLSRSVPCRRATWLG